MTEIQDRIAKLPVWVQEHIKRLETRTEPAIEEAARARRELEDMKARARRVDDANHALIELLSYAGRAGLDWAAKVVDVLDGYEIYRSTDKQD